MNEVLAITLQDNPKRQEAIRDLLIDKNSPLFALIQDICQDVQESPEPTNQQHGTIEQQTITAEEQQPGTVKEQDPKTTSQALSELIISYISNESLCPGFKELVPLDADIVPGTSIETSLPMVVESILKANLFQQDSTQLQFLIQGVGQLMILPDAGDAKYKEQRLKAIHNLTTGLFHAFRPRVLLQNIDKEQSSINVGSFLTETFSKTLKHQKKYKKYEQYIDDMTLLLNRMLNKYKEDKISDADWKDLEHTVTMIMDYVLNKPRNTRKLIKDIRKTRLRANFIDLLCSIMFLLLLTASIGLSITSLPASIIVASVSILFLASGMYFKNKSRVISLEGTHIQKKIKGRTTKGLFVLALIATTLMFVAAGNIINTPISSIGSLLNTANYQILASGMLIMSLVSLVFAYQSRRQNAPFKNFALITLSLVCAGLAISTPYLALQNQAFIMIAPIFMTILAVGYVVSNKRFLSNKVDKVSLNRDEGQQSSNTLMKIRLKQRLRKTKLK